MKQPSKQMGIINKVTLCYCVVIVLQCVVASPVIRKKGQFILNLPIRRGCPFPKMVSTYKSTLLTAIGTGSRIKKVLDQDIKLDLFRKTVWFTPSNRYAGQLSGILHDYDEKISAYKVGTTCLIRALPSNIATIYDLKTMLDSKAQPRILGRPKRAPAFRTKPALRRPISISLQTRYNLKFWRVNNSYSVPLRHQRTPPPTYSSNIKQFCGKSTMYQMDASLSSPGVEHVRKRSTSTSGSCGWDACVVLILWEHRVTYTCESLHRYTEPYQQYGLCLLVDTWLYQ